MAQAVNAATRNDLLQAIRERYRGGLKDEKRRILDEFVAVTGYHRKHAIRLLMHAKPCAAGAVRPARLPVYDAAVREALIVLWEASDRICGKRLKPLLPMLVSALERHGHLTLESTVRPGCWRRARRRSIACCVPPARWSRGNACVGVPRRPCNATSRCGRLRSGKRRSPATWRRISSAMAVTPRRGVLCTR
jgi:hypothetical protein